MVLEPGKSPLAATSDTAQAPNSEAFSPVHHDVRANWRAGRNPIVALRTSSSTPRESVLERIWEHGFEAGTLTRYGLAIALALSVSALRIGFNRIWGEDFPFVFYFPITLFTGLYGGLGPALVSIVITSTMTFLWVFRPIGQLPTISTTVVQGFVVYIFVEIMIALMGSRHREVLNQCRQAERAKNAFLASVSHELRTPLTPILITTSILENDTSLSPAVRSAFDVITRNVHLQAKMVNDLLDLSRAINRKLDLELSQCDLHDIIECALRVCAPDVTAKNLKFIMKFDATRVRVVGDATRLQQVFWNLIQNAMKFTPSDGSITIHSRDVNGGVQVDVSDAGCGIEPAKLQTIFEPFEQASGSVGLQNGRRGLGVGLAIARRIAIAHGGTLFATSEGLNRGSTFTLSLPATARLPS